VASIVVLLALFTVIYVRTDKGQTRNTTDEDKLARGNAGTVPVGHRSANGSGTFSRPAKAVASSEPSAATKAILAVLEKPIKMHFRDDTPLDDVLKYIQESAKASFKSAIPIYVEPVGLQEAEKSLTSTVSQLELEDQPLRSTLQLMLDQLGLAYTVQDGVLFISSPHGVKQENERPEIDADPESPKTQATLRRLAAPVPMPFANETPLEEIVKHIRSHTKADGLPSGVEIYVNPRGLQEAEKTLSSTITIDLEGVPLTTTLRLLLKQLGLAFRVNHDGLVVINVDLENPARLIAHAWELATASNPTERDGAKAVELATKACEKDGFQSADHLDTLAAAHAEAGNFDEAVKWETRAIDQSAADTDTSEYRARLELYKRKKPYHQAQNAFQ
jgi:hypothetical protein